MRTVIARGIHFASSRRADLRVLSGCSRRLTGQALGQNRGMLASQTRGRAAERFGPGAVLMAVAAAGLALAGRADSAPPPAPPVPADTATPAPEAPADDIDQQRAGQIATDRFRGRVLNVEADQARGKPAWEVEVADSRQGRIEVDVSRTSGTIVEMEHD